jgi:hypothetical protein
MITLTVVVVVVVGIHGKDQPSTPRQFPVADSPSVGRFQAEWKGQ